MKQADHSLSYTVSNSKMSVIRKDFQGNCVAYLNNISALSWRIEGSYDKLSQDNWLILFTKLP
jgi:hypothetical protein